MPKDHETGAASSAGPLAGLRVVELGTLIAASFAARLLAEFGAEVIKIEAPYRERLTATMTKRNARPARTDIQFLNLRRADQSN